MQSIPWYSGGGPYQPLSPAGALRSSLRSSLSLVRLILLLSLLLLSAACPSYAQSSLPDIERHTSGNLPVLRLSPVYYPGSLPFAAIYPSRAILVVGSSSSDCNTPGSANIWCVSNGVSWEVVGPAGGGGGGGAEDLGDLGDVDLSSLNAGDVLSFDGADWINKQIGFSDLTGSASDSQLPAEVPLTDETNTFTAAQDLSGGLRFPGSTSLPGTCTTRQIYIDTDAQSGRRVYLCESTNTWVLQGTMTVAEVDSDPTYHNTFWLAVNSATGLRLDNPFGAGVAQLGILLDGTTISQSGSGIKVSDSYNAPTATALAANPSPCPAGQFVEDIDADGTLDCDTPAGSGVGALDDLTDVTLGTPATGEVLRYSGTAWVDAQLAYSDLSGVPSTFAPAAHASSHEDGGSDELQIDWSQLVSVPTDILTESDAGYGLTVDMGVLELDPSQVGAATWGPGSGAFCWEFDTGSTNPELCLNTDGSFTLGSGPGSIYGGVGSGDDLTLGSTTHGTKGSILIPELPDGCLEVDSGALLSTEAACGASSDPNAVTSSGNLTTDLPVLGANNDKTVKSGTRSGNTTEYATVTGSKTAGKQLAYDASGNVIASAYDVGESGGGGGGSYSPTNAYLFNFRFGGTNGVNGWGSTNIFDGWSCEVCTITGGTGVAHGSLNFDAASGEVAYHRAGVVPADVDLTKIKIELEGVSSNTSATGDISFDVSFACLSAAADTNVNPSTLSWGSTETITTNKATATTLALLLFSNDGEHDISSTCSPYQVLYVRLLYDENSDFAFRLHSGRAYSPPSLTPSLSYLDLVEIAPPSAPSSDTARLYAKDDSGDTVVCMKDSDDAETCFGSGGGGGLSNAYDEMTDGTTTAAASGGDVFKFRSASNLLTVAVQSNDGTHGDNLLLTVNQANFSIDWSQLASIPSTFTPAAHALVDAVHTVSGLTTGYVLQATGATSFGFAALAEGQVTQHEAALSIDWSQLTSIPSTFSPSAHATSHNSGGGDALDLSNIAGTLGTGQAASAFVLETEAPAAGDITGSFQAGFTIANDSHLHTGSTLSSIGAAALESNVKTEVILLPIYNGGDELAATTLNHQRPYVQVPFSCDITKAEVTLDQTGSVVVDIWKDTYANWPPVDGDSITASAPPTVSAAIKSQDSTLSGWTTQVNAGDYIMANVDSASDALSGMVALTCVRD